MIVGTANGCLSDSIVSRARTAEAAKETAADNNMHYIYYIIMIRI